MFEASDEIAFVVAKKNKPFSDGELIVKPCLHRISKWVGDESTGRKVNEIALSLQTITQHID